MNETTSANARKRNNFVIITVSSYKFRKRQLIYKLCLSYIIMTFEEIKQKLSNFKVGIAGAGGLGSNCAVSLLRSGISNFIIADFDRVTGSNLNRQYYFSRQVGMLKVDAISENMLKINGDAKIATHSTRVNRTNIQSIFADCHVIVEAFDDKKEKQLLIETVLELFPDKPIVVGSGMAGWGANNDIKTEQYDNVYICGDKTREVSEQLPPIGPRVGIVANMQANQVLEILLGKMV